MFALAASLATWFSLQEVASSQLHVAPDAQALIFMAIAVPAGVAIALALYAPGLASRLALGSRRREPVPAAA